MLRPVSCGSVGLVTRLLEGVFRLIFNVWVSPSSWSWIVCWSLIQICRYVILSNILDLRSDFVSFWLLFPLLFSISISLLPCFQSALLACSIYSFSPHFCPPSLSLVAPLLVCTLILLSSLLSSPPTPLCLQPSGQGPGERVESSTCTEPWIVHSAGNDSPAWLGFSNELRKRRGWCWGEDAKFSVNLTPPPRFPWLKQIN